MTVETTQAHPMPQPRPIPVPEDFPIHWPDPALAMLPWQHRQHLPEPVTPMSHWWAENGFAPGFNLAFAAYQAPMATNVARLNSYFYMSIAPNVPPEQMPEREAESQPLMMAGVQNFATRWDGEWLPELQRTWTAWSATDVAALSLSELLDRVDELRQIWVRAWDIHFELLIPALVGWSEFRELYGNLFGTERDLDAYALLQGIDNLSIEADRTFWTLSRELRGDPELLALTRTTAAEALPARLSESEAGRAFLTSVDAVLERWGKRSDTVQELDSPSWIEDPTPLYNTLKAFVEQDEGPADRQRELAAERERLIAEARVRLKDYPEDARGAFEMLLPVAQGSSRLQEDHNFWIDQRSLHEARQLCLTIGDRLVESGQMEDRGDVFMLTPPELRTIADGELADSRSLVAERRAEISHYARVTPPPMVGTDYGPPPPNPVTRAIMRFFGGPPRESTEVDVVLGNPGSPGKVRGTARVIVTIDEAGRLGAGDILVAPTTSPPWTPFFQTAAAVVTDTGGALSHCAIVAREYGIPAVVGAAGATARIKDGQQIEVDGDRGEVRLLG